MPTTKEDVINYFKDFYQTNNRSPLSTEFAKKTHPFSCSTIKRLFGTWNNALEASGLELGVVREPSFETTCKTCQTKIIKQSNEKNENGNYFCSHTCSAKYTNLGRKISDQQKMKTSQKMLEYNSQIPKIILIDSSVCLICGITFEFKVKPSIKSRKYCSNKCIGTMSSKTRVHKDKLLNEKCPKEKCQIILIDSLTCLGCGILFETPSSKPKKYCSKCARTINSRSKNEIYFSELCKEWFSNVLENEKMFDGWDSDVILPDKKIAIAWNGSCHYKQIWNNQSLKQVQSRDKIKTKIIEKYGYDFYVIQDMGKANKKFVEEQFEIFRLMQIRI
jgi:hypothetical protein